MENKQNRQNSGEITLDTLAYWEEKREFGALKMQKAKKFFLLLLPVLGVLLTYIFWRYKIQFTKDQSSSAFELLTILCLAILFPQLLLKKFKTFAISLIIIIPFLYFIRKFDISAFNYLFQGAFCGIILTSLAIIIYENIYLLDFKEWFRIKFKKQMIKEIIKEISPNLTYEAYKFIKFEEFDIPQIYSEGVFDIYDGNDLVCGEIDGVNIKFSDVKYSKIVPSTKIAENKVMFFGILFIADFNKTFRARVAVLDNFDRFAKSHLPLTTMDNMQFSDIFTTHCDDKIAAKYILSHALMEKLLKLRETLNTRCNFCFFQNKIFIYLNFNRDSFEKVDYNKPIIGENSITQQYKSEIMQIIDIIKDLNLNSKIFKPNFGSK